MMTEHMLVHIFLIDAVTNDDKDKNVIKNFKVGAMFHAMFSD